MKDLVPPSDTGRRMHADGWTHDRRVTFLVALAASGSVTIAAASAGLSRKTAYALKKRESDFAALWDRSLAAAQAARLKIRRMGAKGNEGDGGPKRRQPINFINRRSADLTRRDRFFARLESLPPPQA